MHRILKENKGQGSAELILLIGSILIIVILIGNYIFQISNGINNSLKELIGKQRDDILYRLWKYWILESIKNNEWW